MGCKNSKSIDKDSEINLDNYKGRRSMSTQSIDPD